MCVWGEMVDSDSYLPPPKCEYTMFNANCDFCVAINCNCITSIAISFVNIGAHRGLKVVVHILNKFGTGQKKWSTYIYIYTLT